MYFISNSMPKSASTLLCQLTKFAVSEVYGDAGQEAIGKAISKGDIPGFGSFINGFSSDKVTRLLNKISLESGPFVVKTHLPLTKPLESVIDAGEAKLSFIFRDPRDALLSAMDNYAQSKKTKNPEFIKFSSFESALEQYGWWAEQAVIWKQSGKATILQYENFVQDKVGELDRMLVSLALDLPKEKLSEFVSSASSMQKSNGWNLRFNKGVSQRFKKEMSAKNTQACSEALGPYLDRLGYSV